MGGFINLNNVGSQKASLWGSVGADGGVSLSPYGGLRLSELSGGDTNKSNGFVSWLKSNQGMLNGSIEDAYKSYLSANSYNVAQEQQNDVLNRMRSMYKMS